jgi:hypothetical protein
MTILWLIRMSPFSHSNLKCVCTSRFLTSYSWIFLLETNPRMFNTTIFSRLAPVSRPTFINIIFQECFFTAWLLATHRWIFSGDQAAFNSRWFSPLGFQIVHFTNSSAKKRPELLIVLSDSVINIPLTSYRLLHHFHRKALSRGLSSLLHFEVPYQDYYAPAALLKVQYDLYRVLLLSILG